MTNQVGRPTKFSEQLITVIANLKKKGLTNRQIAQTLGIAESSLYLWIQRYEFSETIKEAEDIATDLVEMTLFSKAIGYQMRETKAFCYEGTVITEDVIRNVPPDTAAAIFWLKNRRPERWKDKYEYTHPEQLPTVKKIMTFSEFCVNAGYPAPFPKQLEMYEFAINNEGARLLLGARGYGKTDYLTVLGLAYKIYLNPDKTRFLIITKSDERNAAMLKEIGDACEKAGVTFEKKNSTSIRVKGLLGKDHTVSSVTIGSVTLRGRHPDLVIMDDPVTEDDSSEATRRHAQKVYNEASKLVKNILIIGQPVHKYDLYQTLRTKIKLMEVPHGSIPELDHDLEAQRLAGVEEASIQASYYLKILSEGVVPFENIQYVDKFPSTESVAFIDPSFKGGDYTAITILTGYFQGVAVVGDCWKKSWDHCLDDMDELLKKYKVRKLFFENNSLGTQPLDVLRTAFGNAMSIQGWTSNSNKHSRIMTAGAYSHLIHLSKECGKIYTKQVVEYEFNAKNDDAPDSLASCLTVVGLIRGKV